MQEKGFKTLRFNTLKAYKMKPEKNSKGLWLLFH